jgi:sugar phosphate isomerase/epimerase
MIDELLSMGFDRVELGYDTRVDLVAGIKTRIAEGAVRVESVHNFCPVPMTAMHPGPEIYTLADPDPRVRQSAVTHTANTIRFAAETGAKFVVCHAGNVDMQHFSMGLWDLAAAGRQFTPQFEKTKMKMQLERDKRAPKQLQHLESGVASLLPVLDETGVALCFENLPSWESIPTEMELETLLRKFNTPRLRYWHDVGHGQIRQNMGLINQERWLERLSPWLAGMHVHDVVPPAMDHVMPPKGHVDFPRLKRFAEGDIVRVIEPSSRTTRDDVESGLAFFKQVWGSARE